jgi:uncharacterized protein YggE
MDNGTVAQPPVKNSSVKLSLNLKYICLALLLVIIAMFAIWRPWSAAAPDNSRVVKVTGEAKLKATPDEFVFNPSYEFKNADKNVALADMTQKSEELVKKIKELGVAESNIKSNSSGYNGAVYYYNSESKQSTYNLQLTITVGTKELAQKVQDYLVTTLPTGAVSPQAGFSDSKRKELEQKARDEATKEARTKAEQSAKNLGFKIGNVKSIDDAGGFDNGGCGSGRLCAGSTLAVPDAKTSQLAVQPGVDELNYSVTVEYYIK